MKQQTGRRSRICPHCGSRRTVPVQWRGPEIEYSPIDGTWHGGYEVPDPEPRYHCLDCGRDICYKVDEWEEHTKSFEFVIGRTPGDNFVLRLTRSVEGESAVVELTRYWRGGPDREKTQSRAGAINRQGFEKYLKRIYRSCILEWEPEYNDFTVMDGTNWQVTLQYDDRDPVIITGRSAYPPLWKRFLRAVNSLEIPDVS